MKSKPKTSQYAEFENVLKRVLKVTHEELKDRIEKEKAAKKRPVSRVSSGKD